MIHSYKRFYRALSHLVDKGFKFELVETCLPVRRGDGEWVFAYSIVHRRRGGSYESPIVLIHNELVNKGKPRTWVESSILETWDFQEKGHEIREATNETGYHDPKVRAKLLEVCRVKEKDQYKRRLVFKDKSK